MTIDYLSFTEAGIFSKFDTDFANHHPNLADFQSYSSSLDGLEQAASERSKFKIDRNLLVNTLERQYKALNMTPANKGAISALNDDKTFTITTAHQPVLFTGPIYFIYKAISAISLSRRLNDHLPNNRIIPMMVIGGEDHDKEEIDHLHIFGKTVRWATKQSGPCGRFSLSDIQPVIEQLLGILGESPHALELKDMISSSFLQDRSYGQAMQHFVHQLLGPYGIIVINMDDHELKKAFIPILKDEIQNQTSKNIITKTQAQIEATGYKPATFLRDINVFYLSEGERSRIELEGGKYIVQDGGPTFTPEAIVEEIEKNPENFSPNVNMRPLYQELILPNLAYVGGGGELAYWTERKSHFDYYDIHYPVLIRRDSAFWLDKGMVKKMSKVGLAFNDFLQDVDSIISDYIDREAQNEIHIDNEIKAIQKVLDAITEKGATVEHTLKPAFEAESTKILKSLDQMASRMVREEKKNHEITINQIRQIKDKLFPNGNIQERHDNFMTFYLKYGRKLFETLLHQFDPLRNELKIIRDDG